MSALRRGATLRKLVVFLAVFGTGLAVLLLFARQRDRRTPTAPPLPPSEPQVEDPSSDPMFPLPGEGGEEDEPSGFIRVGGKWTFTRFDPNDREAEHPLSHMVVDDARTLDAELHELNRIAMQVFNPRTGELRATLDAARGEARLAMETGSVGLKPTEPIQLWDVEITLIAGAPFVPLTLHVPRLTADLERSLFNSTDPVTLDGSGMEASSVGLEIREQEGVVKLLREGSIDLSFEEGTRAELDATGDGAITLTRAPVEPGSVRAEASIEVEGGALLVLEGKESLRSTSERLLIRGDSLAREPGSDEPERFVPRLAVATGAVDLRRLADSFTGSEARFDFAPDGALERATLTGEPTASVWVDAALEGREPSGRVKLELSGAGPLVSHFRPQAGFDLTGPGRVVVPANGLVVTARDRIAGNVLQDESRGHVDLEGEVVATLGDSVFRGPSLAIDFSRDEAGEPLVEASCPGPSELTGIDPKGRKVRIETQGEARWVLRAGAIEVPLAQRAHLRVEGQDGFEAWAGVLRDFRQADLTFVAEEGVEYSSARGATSAPRVESRGPEDLLFSGDAETRAIVQIAAGAARDLESGTLSARSIERVGARVTATGEVELDLAARQGTHELECAWLEFTSPEPAAEGDERRFDVRARDVERAELEGEFGAASLTGRELELSGRFLAGPRVEGAPPPAEIERLEARRAVRVDFRDEAQFAGEGERFVWTPAEGGRLEGSAAERARAWGRLSANDLPYRMSAESMRFSEDRLDAAWPQIVLDEALPAPRERAEDVLIGASSEWMSADRGGVLFSGVAHLVGRLSSGRDWTLNAGQVHLFFHEEDLPIPSPAGALRSIVAWDGFAVTVGEELRASGDLLDVDFETLRMEGRPARLELLGFVWESTAVEYDLLNTLVRTEQGTLTGGKGTELEGWTLRYESLRPFETPDATILVVRNPVFTNVERAEELRAAWALFWVDRDHWRSRTARWLGTPGEEDLRTGALEEEAPEVQVETPNIFGEFRTSQISRLLNEVYVEGDVEYQRAGRRVARVGAAYLDLVDGHGWLKDAEVHFPIEVRDQPATLVARADWMRHSADGSLHADSAIATTCTFAEPHFFVRTKDLRFTPSAEEDVTWEVSLRKNALKFENGLGLPLPAISYDSDTSGRPIFDRLVFGNTARFGSFVEATVNGSLGAAGDAVASVSGVDVDDVDGRIRYRASYLGSRGVLLGTGIEAKAQERMWMNLYLDGTIDRGEDKGIVRVDPDDRSDARYFLRGRARYTLTGREWFDFALAEQSDPGVQSEFFEDEFLRYEQRDNFVHWRKGENGDYRSVTARARLDEFRTYVEELPAVALYGGLAPLTTVHGLPLLYRANTDYALLRRLIGTSDVVSPFDPTFDDDLGDVDILRLDTDHRFEVPIPIDAGSWTVSPFTSFRGTFWSQAIGEEEWAARGDALAGFEASSSYFRTSSRGLVHSVTPTFGVHTDIVSAEDGGDPIPIDEVEDPRRGTYLDVGVRNRWYKLDEDEQLSIDLRSTHAADVEAGAPDGWLGLAVLGELSARVGSVPVVLNHDGRYDFDDGITRFSRSRLGFSPHPSLGFEVGFGTGRDSEEQRLYEAATAGARWRASPKWEFEGSETIDLRGNSNLDTRLLLRRYGHDIIFELEIADRSGEGQSFSVGVRPALGFRHAPLGLIERWLSDHY